MAVGFYGKLPSHGDFLHRGLPDEFVNRWDAWLQEGIARSRRDLGEAWLDVFLTSPLWRFALASGVAGAPAWAGILLPSVDRVGRYFPLTIAAELAPGVAPFEASVAGNAWFDWAESAVRRALEEELVDLERLDAQLQESDALLDSVRAAGPAFAIDAVTDGEAPVWTFALAPDGDMGRFFARFADGLAAPAREPLALWWSVGSDRVAPSVLMTAGLPPATAFRDLLGAPGVLGGDAFADTLVRSQEWPAVHGTGTQSAAISDVGRWRAENQDAFVERAEAGVWAVADGMGGHQGGALASQLVAERVRCADVDGDVTAAAQGVAAAIAAANSELRDRGSAEPGFDGGSTVVALCVRGGEGIVLWAGDSRLYRLRAGELTQLTRDHSVAEEGGPSTDDPHMITRAVGGADELALDECRVDILPGDRFLLCSDGLYGDLAPTEIAQRLAAADCAAAATGLVALALERGGEDNATAIVVAVGTPAA